MADCRVLFVGAIWLRRVCLILMIAAAVIICTANKIGCWDKIKYIAGGIWRYLIGIIIAMAALAGIIALNFEKAFITFHHIFFDNDLWLLDPDTDNLINIVPQTFFSDICIRIGIIFIILTILLFSMAIITESVIIKKLNLKNNQ